MVLVLLVLLVLLVMKLMWLGLLQWRESTLALAKHPHVGERLSLEVLPVYLGSAYEPIIKK